MKRAGWIWYPGDLELYHALKQNFSRVERGMGWPAYWKSSSFHQRIALWREYRLAERTEFRVTARGTGFIRLIEEPLYEEGTDDLWNIREISRTLERKEYKHRFGETVACGPGKVTVILHLGRIEALPAAYVEGEVICSDEGWLADDYGTAAVPAGSSPYFTRPEQDPAVWEYSRERLAPVRSEAVPGGTLYEWETEMTAGLEIEAAAERLASMTVYPGESREEALDPEHCYLRWNPELPETGGLPTREGSDGGALPGEGGASPVTGTTPRCAVRYAYIPGPPVKVTAVRQYVDFPVRARFRCDDPLLNRIWEVAEHTFRLCSGIFFIDGIKRDQWIWSGDAYQSMFVNRYLLADADIERRTLLALRGGDPVTGHINTIVDYSLFWFLSLQEHRNSAGDIRFLRQIWPKAQSLMAFCEGRLDDDGFLVGRDRDWTYIDWADLDKEGPVAGEQMLLSAAYLAMAELAEALAADSSPEDGTACGAVKGAEEAAGSASAEGPAAEAERYRRKASLLREKIQKMYWSEDAGAYVDSFASGRNHISRQTNILALRTGTAEEEQIPRIVRNVLKNDAVPPIRTPYFQFYALDALGTLGETEEVLRTIREYWGGMLERGAVTFWEEFDPAVTGREQYDMYGDMYGKSLCHAWAASPVYLISRYLVGLELTGPSSFILAPRVGLCGSLDCTLPVGMDGASVHIRWDDRGLTAESEGADGVLKLGEECLPLKAGEKLRCPGQRK